MYFRIENKQENMDAEKNTDSTIDSDSGNGFAENFISIRIFANSLYPATGGILQ